MLIWVLSHVGIHGNEMANIYAKRAISSTDSIQTQICSFHDIITLKHIIVSL